MSKFIKLEDGSLFNCKLLQSIYIMIQQDGSYKVCALTINGTPKIVKSINTFEESTECLSYIGKYLNE